MNPRDDQNGAEDAQLRLALDEIVADSLPAVATVLAALYLLFAVGHLLVLSATVAGALATVAGATSLVLAGVRLALGRYRVAARWAHPLGAGIAALVLFNSLLHLYLLADPLQTTNLLLLIIACGSLFLSRLWFALAVLAVFGGWAGVVVALGFSPAWQHFGFALAVATALAAVVFSVRRRNLWRLEELHLSDERQKRELRQALDEMRRARGELEQANGHLREARALAEEGSRAKSQFLANMSHELRTPLNAIIGYSEMLAEDVRDEDLGTMAEDLEKVGAAARHLLLLIDDVLDLSKIEAGRIELEPTTFAVASLIQDAVEAVQVQAERNGNRLHTEIVPGLGSMHSDATRVRQCIFNLLTNACKFTSDGEVHVRAERRHERGGEHIFFSVRDTGIGMSREEQARVFSSFVQADVSTTRRFGGTGLGLAITRRLCRIMGGDIQVQSAPGKGATFTFWLPVAIGALGAAGERSARQEELR